MIDPVAHGSRMSLILDPRRANASSVAGSGLSIPSPSSSGMSAPRSECHIDRASRIFLVCSTDVEILMCGCTPQVPGDVSRSTNLHSSGDPSATGSWYQATVTRIRQSWDDPDSNPCTDPFPKVLSPRMIALSQFLSRPATSSDALADDSSTRITSGSPSSSECLRSAC